MNTESAWQAYFDENPEDFFARQAYADWLEEHAEPRLNLLAAGMRALGRLSIPIYWAIM